MGNMPKSHTQIVKQIVEKELGEVPRHIHRMTTGLANEVYSASLSSKDVIVRMNTNEKSMTGTEAHIALFKSVGITVPEMIASDYSKTFVPFAYQIQSKLPGRDINDVISSLTEQQLKDIAHEIAFISKKLSSLPTTGMFGWIGGRENDAPFSSWLKLLSNMRKDVTERNAQTGVVSEKYISMLKIIIQKYREYFRTVPSIFYYDDMSSKNVLIHGGKFVGLVDLDTVAYGDPLEGIGRIEASWYGTAYGTTYTNAIMSELGLDKRQKEIVSVYAILNRIFSLSERGIKFNENTSTKIDLVAVKEDEKIIDAMLVKLDLHP